MANRETAKPEIIGLLGVGLDNTDGHQRITRSEEFLLVGGSRETHENMQDFALRFSDSLRQKGKRLQGTPVQEVIDLLKKAGDR